MFYLQVTIFLPLSLKKCNLFFDKIFADIFLLILEYCSEVDLFKTILSVICLQTLFFPCFTIEQHHFHHDDVIMRMTMVLVVIMVKLMMVNHRF